jgi:hypothetical protein
MIVSYGNGSQAAEVIRAGKFVVASRTREARFRLAVTEMIAAMRQLERS